MAVNQALIQASRGTGEQFIDYGAVLQPVVKGIMRDLEIADNKMASFINNLPPGANIEKLPEGMKPEVDRYLRQSKNEFAEAAKIASKLSPSDAGYREAVEKMNSIKTGFVNLNKNLEAHLANRVEFIEDKNDLSKSLGLNDNTFLTSVYAGDYDGFKVSGGELEFLDKTTGKRRRNSDFPQYSLIDVVGSDGVARLFDNERKLGVQNLTWNPKRSGREVGRLFKKVGNQGVVDMAFDGFDEMDGNFIDTVVKQELAPNMSNGDWLVSDQREKLKTSDGFAPYRAGFQNFVSDVIKDGFNEGKTAYNNKLQSQLKARGSDIKGVEGDNIWGSWRKPEIILDMSEKIKQGAAAGIEYISGWDNKIYWPQQDGTFKEGDDNGAYSGEEEVVRSKAWLYDNFSIPLILRTASKSKNKNKNLDPNKGMPKVVKVGGNSIIDAPMGDGVLNLDLDQSLLNSIN
tara:strand:- start:210 stop:1583 length:1374 start_codon:yes stop_codon:yes gene_type:complete